MWRLQLWLIIIDSTLTHCSENDATYAYYFQKYAEKTIMKNYAKDVINYFLIKLYKKAKN